MQILNFEAKGLYELNSFLRENLNNKFPTNEKTMRELLKTININFVLEGINRFHSTIICEVGLSYVQQSQRYVNSNKSGIYLANEKLFREEELTLANNLMTKSFELYKKMTELKDNIKGRPSKDDFKYGISFEDARYILPLSVTTNMSVAMSADRLIDLFDKMYEYEIIFEPLINEFKNKIPNLIYNIITGFMSFKTADPYLITKYYQDKFNYIDGRDDVIEIVNDINVNKNIAIGALSSTVAGSPVATYETMDSKDVKEMIIRVLGYGHDGIVEQNRNTFVMTCSLTAYHQFIRHRIQNIQREDLMNIIHNRELEYYIPESIKDSIFLDDYINLIKQYNNFLINASTLKDRNRIVSKQLFLNCHKIRFVVSNNGRADGWMYRERLCMNAQTEIREMMHKKFNISKGHSDIVFNHFLPPCVNGGKCKEGKLSCGKIKEMQEKYK